MSKTRSTRPGLVTVGLKILLGVSLASNLFIGALLVVNIRSSSTVGQKVDQVLAIREKLSSNLRAAIVALQGEFLAMPDFFRIDPRTQIFEAIKSTFTITDHQMLKGRKAYSDLYSRNERRDLTKNKYVIQSANGSITVSSGMADRAGKFTEDVERLTIASASPTEDAERVRTLIETVTAEANSPQMLQQRVHTLEAKIADSSLQAEATRNEILQHVEEIRAKESELQTLRNRQHRFSLVIGALAIFANMAALFLLVRTIVEKPLRTLTKTIEEIRAGNTPVIPYRNRRDQIGVLSGAIGNFGEALLEIQTENKRKAEEKLIIEEMTRTITGAVNSLESRARELVNTAESLRELASSTENRSESVARLAGDTALHTNTVSDATSDLRTSFREIEVQIGDQNSIVALILENNSHSRTYIKALNDSIHAIHTIIGTVSDITDQTKLLALNATIEAARAGEAGRGFAVVASEVKGLSLKTEQATDDVLNKIEAIEKASSILFSHLNSIDERMQSLNQLTGNITRAIGGQQQVTSTIAHLAGQTSENTRTVSSSIGEVSSAAASTRTLAGQVHEFSSEISRELTGLLAATTTKLESIAGSAPSR